MIASSFTGLFNLQIFRLLFCKVDKSVQCGFIRTKCTASPFTDEGLKKVVNDAFGQQVYDQSDIFKSNQVNMLPAECALGITNRVIYTIRRTFR